jgi:hypothetical protein
MINSIIGLISFPFFAGCLVLKLESKPSVLQFKADSWSSITEEIDFYHVEEDNTFSGQVNASNENQYYLNYTFVILNLLSNISYDIEVELKYYYDIQPYVKTLNGKTLVGLYCASITFELISQKLLILISTTTGFRSDDCIQYKHII